MIITNLKAREILDSKGHPTLEAEITLEDGTKALGGVPSGASTGATEASELRDQDPNRYFGKGVLKAVETVNTTLKQLLIGRSALEQKSADYAMIDADGTELKTNLGGNSILACSMAICRAAARWQRIPLYEHIGNLSSNNTFTLPQPMILVMEGGKHGNWATDVQEFMIIPRKEHFPSFRESLRAGAEIFHSLEKILEEKKYSTGVGMEGAFAPQELASNEEAFDLIAQAIHKSGYEIGKEVVFSIDAAASEFFQDGQYVLKSENNIQLSGDNWVEKIKTWQKKYPVWSIEDPFDQESWQDWAKFLKDHEGKDKVPLQLVGDDLVTTNIKRIQKAIDYKSINSVLIKINQIGTITETLEAIKKTKEAGFTTVISHRAGEANDDFIADLAVGTNAGQTKFGGPDRGERLAKYNRLLRIEEELI